EDARTAARMVKKDELCVFPTRHTKLYPMNLAAATTGTGISRQSDIPWYLWCSALAVTSAYIGGYWDISWHRSIGRDTFWTPPHMAIYACGVLAGICSAYLILTATLGRDIPLRDASVRIWGLVGPLGAFIL